VAQDERQADPGRAELDSLLPSDDFDSLDFPDSAELRG
jgi:hypothetical protein